MIKNPAIGYQSTMNYLSCIRRLLETKHGVQIFKADPEWYKVTRKRVTRAYVLACIEGYITIIFCLHFFIDGTKLKQHAPPMTLEDLGVIGRILFQQNESKSSKDRTLLNAQWISIGRGSDVGEISFTDIHWMDGFFISDITRRKVSRQHSLSVFPSALLWEQDMLHSIATQIVCEPYDASIKVFPQIGAYGSNELKVAAYINRILKV